MYNMNNLQENEKCFLETKMNIEEILPIAPIVKQLNGKLYVVGGSVRDSVIAFLDTKTNGNYRLESSLDIDLLVTGIEYLKLKEALSTIGSVDLVGESFGVIVFSYGGKTVDIALPRTERSIGKGHQDFEVNSDPTLTVFDDLCRRDITINAIAWDVFERKLIDPHGGIEDIQKKLIRTVGKAEDRFNEDPLRMLRAVGFSIRKHFQLHDNIDCFIKNNLSLFDSISNERIRKEFCKIINFNNINRFHAGTMDILNRNGLFKHLFNVNAEYHNEYRTYGHASFFSLLGIYENLNFDRIAPTSTEKWLLSAFRKINNIIPLWQIVKNLNDVNLLKSVGVNEVLLHVYTEDHVEFLKTIPWCAAQLAVDGEWFIAHEITGSDIGYWQKEILKEIHLGRLSNFKYTISKFICDKMSENNDELLKDGFISISSHYKMISMLQNIFNLNKHSITVE